ncbi:MAG: ABC transporter ATP-binding protein [Nitrospiraceae bacterium]
MTAITVDDIRKVYSSGGSRPVRAVDGVSFEVARGQIFGLLGPNGAGKTTLVKILTTITVPTSGRARICGFDVVRQALDVRRQIAVVLQQTAVETLLTIEDNLRIYAYLHGVSSSEVRKRMDAVLDEFDLREKARETVQDLSLGTKRRVQVAKVFMVDSPVIFLDESTTGMDPLMRRRMLDRIRREARNGRTILLTTQVLSEAEELCDRIMIIDRGKTLAAGTLQELRRLSTQMFQVSLTLARGHDVRGRLQSLKPVDLRVEDDRVELLFKGEEARLLSALADLSRVVPIRHFEVRGAGLEDIFVDLVDKKETRSEPEAGP